MPVCIAGFFGVNWHPSFCLFYECIIYLTFGIPFGRTLDPFGQITKNFPGRSSTAPVSIAYGQGVDLPYTLCGNTLIPPYAMLYALGYVGRTTHTAKVTYPYMTYDTVKWYVCGMCVVCVWYTNMMVD
ncbi:hypothetical protein PIROE2DRAFT_3315 [Piromyces sp. E2]|nr:hypothetical protein PIROE2DRAFT_3315 [Piromyces sp. E2]|eukprot:OUM68925.1 hypothetical protein PIROE2DRAFT_3315 [Piromyces sp. E2]